ncbi:unnamed protein product [Adineta ricciae]|uniref:FAD-binding domain-containing protein n=1 Tax=Adineta ricciae TaxID=249248 RepID=A0A815RPG7_ADIRI|nr:unnamed protein product [Adineta ricciae]
MTLGETFRIAIIGGGLAGLSLAIGLKQKGFQNLIVYEREENSHVRHQGWSVSLMAPEGGLGFIKQLGILPELSAISFQPSFRAVDGSTLLFVRGTENGRRFKRAELRDALYQVCVREGIEVVWDARVKSFEEIDNKVHVHFVDETKHEMETVDLLIGADGAHSPIRKQLTGDEAQAVGFNSIVGLIKKVPDGSNDDLFEHEYVRNSGVLVSGRNVSCWYAHHVLHDEVYWSLSIRSEEDFLRQRTDYDKKKLHDLALEYSQKFFPLIQILVQRTPIEQMQDCLIFKDIEPMKRDASGRYCVSQTGRITLVGDSAHAMIPFRGQGGNTALMAAWNLTEKLGAIANRTTITNDELNEILMQYENERIPLGTLEILESRENAERFHSANVVRNFVRNTIMRTTMSELSRKAFVEKFIHDLTSSNMSNLDRYLEDDIQKTVDSKIVLSNINEAREYYKKEQDGKSTSQWTIVECEPEDPKNNLLRARISHANKTFDTVYTFSPVGKIQRIDAVS